jgi:tellurite resistance protein
MIPEFNSLSSDEVERMHKAPMLVCILIAGADGRIDQSEISKAISLATTRQKTGKSRLLEFYSEVGSDFEDKLKIVIQGFPVKEKERAPKVIAELAQLNDILSKLDKEFSVQFYRSLTEIALEIAKSSGGVLGMKTVGQEEARYLSLNMIEDPSLL